MEENFEQGFDAVVMELLAVLKEKVLSIICVTMICSLLGCMYASFLVTPKYEASINMIVNTKTDVTGTVTNDNISSAQKLVDTYAIIIKSNIVLNQVINTLDLDMTYDELYENVSVDAINNTQVMKISVRNSRLVVAKKIVETISEVAPDIVTDAVEAGSCKVVSLVDGDENPVSPNILQYTMITGVIGFIVWVAIVSLRELLHDSIVDDMDVERKLEIPVLGIIPDVEEKNNGND